MGRRHIYYCDNCKKDFGNDIHINIKSAQAAISYPNKMDAQDPSKSEWSSRPVAFESKEFHFCNGKCLGEWLDNKVAKVIENIHNLYIKVAEKKEG